MLSLINTASSLVKLSSFNRRPKKESVSEEHAMFKGFKQKHFPKNMRCSKASYTGSTFQKYAVLKGPRQKHFPKKIRCPKVLDRKHFPKNMRCSKEGRFFSTRMSIRLSSCSIKHVNFFDPQAVIKAGTTLTFTTEDPLIHDISNFSWHISLLLQFPYLQCSCVQVLEHLF